MDTDFETVSELVKHITDDKAFQKDVAETIASKSVAKGLFALRCASELSQQEMAKRLDWTTAKVGRFERLETSQIKLGDLAAYLGALGRGLALDFVPTKEPAAQKIKFHAFQIKKHLDSLAGIGAKNKDKKLREGIRSFFGECAINLLHIVGTSAAKLPESASDLELQEETIVVQRQPRLRAGEEVLAHKG